MKRILLIYLSLWITLAASAQKLYYIIYADTNDATIGKAAKISMNQYAKTCGQIATALVYPDDSPSIKYGYDCNKENLLKDIEKLNCTEKDIVIFVYCGHGSRSPIDKSDFPQMCMAKRLGQNYWDGDDYVSLEGVKNMIMQKKPQFCLVIGDCCNSVDPNLPPKDPTGDPNGGIDAVMEGNSSILNLFAKQKGSVILTGSQKGGYGWSNSSFGMYMQREFSREIQRVLDSKANHSTWESLLSKVKSNTEQWNIVDNYGKIWKQHPFYQVNVTPVVKEKKKVKVKEKEKEKKEKEKEEMERPNPKREYGSDIRSQLLQIADDRNFTDEQRIEKREEVLNKYFSDACIIDVAGKDGIIITLSLTAEQYLRRISLEIGLTNVVIFEQSYDRNGKINHLELHEIYREVKRKIQ